MKAWMAGLFATLSGLGGIGILLMGILDSSFLFLPLGNDLLVLGLTASHHARLAYYALMAAAGSTLGCLLMDVVSRHGGEEGLAKLLSTRQLRFVKSRVGKSAGWAVATACLMPPPFPFTPFIMAAAALQYPRSKLLSTVFGARALRFVIVGLLAIRFGRNILNLADAPFVHYALIGLVVVMVCGSVLSIYTWIRRSRSST